MLCEIAQVDFARDRSIHDADIISYFSDYCIPAVAETQIFEKLANMYRLAGNVERAKELELKAIKILPLNCRTHWKNMTMLDEVLELPHD